MGKTKPAALATGQIWRVGKMNLEVGNLGPRLVEYKLAKPDAVRIKKAINSKATIETYLKKNKAVLIQG